MKSKLKKHGKLSLISRIEAKMTSELLEKSRGQQDFNKIQKAPRHS